MSNALRFDAYRFLNRFGFKEVFYVTQPDSGRDTFILKPELGIPSIVQKEQWLYFYGCPLTEVTKDVKPFLVASVRERYKPSTIEKFAQQINENLWFNRASMLRIEVESPHENEFFVSALFFKRAGTLYPLLTFGEIGFNPMYFLDNEYEVFTEYLERKGFDVQVIPYGINSQNPDFN